MPPTVEVARRAKIYGDMLEMKDLEEPLNTPETILGGPVAGRCCTAPHAGQDLRTDAFRLALDFLSA